MRLIRIFAIVTLLALTILAPSPAIAQDTSTPPVPLDGRTSYAENCAPCHGANGGGDGPSASGLSVPPTALGTADAIAGRSFQALFDVTKNGNMARMMPPWKNQLSDQEIWDTVAYAWSLHTSSAEADQGNQVYDANCATCHGADGKASQDGVPSLADFAATKDVTQATWAASVANGKGAMPGFAGRLSDADQAAALVYARTLSLGGPLFRPPLAAGTGVISGTITNRTTGAPLADAEVQLGIFDQASQLESRTATTDATGTYRFTDLPADAGVAFAVRVTYPENVPYSSAFVTFEDGATELNLPISVYETTNDPAGVRAERVHYIIEFDSGVAFVAELLVFSHDGERTYVGDGNHVLAIPLPAGAQDLEVNDGELGARFLQIDNGFVDLLPLPPGDNVRQILFRYSLPFSGTSLDLVRSLPYPASAINALISDVGQQVSSEELATNEKRQSQSGAYHNLSAQGVPANQPITLRITGLPSSTGGGVAMGGGAAAASTDSGVSRWVILGAIAAAIAAAAALLVALPMARGRGGPLAAGGVAEGAPSGAGDADDLIDALAQLDLAHEAGEISDSAYRERRLRLKAQLRDVMRKEPQG